MHSFGICTLSVLCMRTEPSDRSELCSQLLFGEAYTVLQASENGKWLLVENTWDKYQGWISITSHFEVSETYFVRYSLGKHHTSHEAVGKLQFEGQNFPLRLPFASTLPFFENGKVDLDTRKATCLPEKPAGKPENERALYLNGIISYLHAPYLWGGRTPLGVDCSGFSQNVYKAMGRRLDRDAYQQAEQGSPISLPETQTGDLAFFQREGRVIHVGIILAQSDAKDFGIELPTGKTFAIAHALDAVRIDAFDEKGIFHLQKQIYTHEFAQARRYVS